MIKKITKDLLGLFFTVTSVSLITSIGVVLDLITARPSLSAEAVRFYLDGPVMVSLSLESLETFAITGEITGNLKLFALFLDDEMMEQLRQGLQQRFPLNVVQTYNLSYSPLGREAIAQVGKIVKFSPNSNGFYGLRAAVIGAAANSDEEGWTILDAIAQFPSKNIEVDVQDLFQLKKFLDIYLDYNQAAVDAIAQQAKINAELESDLDLTNLADLNQPGSYSFKQQTITVTNPALRQTQAGLSVNYDFPVDVYIPQGLTEPAPIVIISHGFGAVKENFVYIAEHLASYGFVVFVPDHVGSDLSYREIYLQGRLNTLLSPIEFINRPQEISFLIDQLEEVVASDAQWSELLNLEQIGVMGDSLGGTTALSLAGAEINHGRLDKTCAQENVILNFSLYLQCQAEHLPPQNYDLGDPRIKAAIAGHPLASGIFGPEGMSTIKIPLLITAGSQDLVAPVVTEQIHPFVWLESELKYLALFNPGTHFATSEPDAEGAESIPPILIGEYQEFGRQYFKSLNIAFFETYLRDNTEYNSSNHSDFSSYLTSAYGQFISQENPMSLEIIKSLSTEDLKAAYGKKPPLAIVPDPVEPTIANREESVMEQIKRTGLLKIAMRRDAPPFGYIDEQQQWSGYCSDLLVELSNYLTKQLDLDLEIKLVELPSTLKNRFTLIQDNLVELECGPNTIRQDIPGITFSNFIGVSGTRFLSQEKRQAAINPNQSLQGVQVGILKNTTTEKLIQTNYPQAELVYFEGPQGRVEAIQAVTEGSIDTFATDSILSIAEVALQNLPFNDYSWQPKLPLGCNFYGLVLPNDDPQWRATVNKFLSEPAVKQIREKWFNQIMTVELNDLEYCFNR